MAAIALTFMSTDPGAEPDTFKLFRSLAMDLQLRSMAAWIAARSVLRRLEDRSISAVVIKGPAVERFHPRGLPRPYSDVDLLVRPSDFRAAVALCEEEGFVDDTTHPQWPWFDLLCKEGVNLHRDDGGNLDVHHHVPPWVFGARLTPDAVLDLATWDEIAGVPVRFADADRSLVIASLHVLNDLWKGRIGLGSWRDILVLLDRVGIEAAESTFDELKLGWLLGLVTDTLAAGVPEAQVPRTRRAHRIPLAVRARIGALGWSRATSFSRQQASWCARLPLPAAMAFLGGCIVPAPRYIDDRYGSYRSYWRTMYRDAVSTLHGEDHRMKTHATP
jgi:hypothetical protein